ncbi:NADH dehydrogenase [ubiquinone] flavoprotein 3, mitochondrial-like [Lineus longissimus]|uniref:NADH dehydrogenase [ubiquinone] flavoprotein 3, mitochondrial-like n=1 Tax=Lineus longissimus TaxID=88925 RepID=UPI002B4F02C3
MSLLHCSKSALHVLPRLAAVRLFPYTTGTGAPPSGTTPKPATKTTTPAPTVPASNNKSYKVTEYYGHNEMTFYDYEVTMRKSRLPQPSAVKK